MDGMMTPMMGPGKPVSKCPYENLKLTPTDNGSKVTYYEKGPSSGGKYEHVEMTHKEFGFSAKEFKKAVAKYKEVSDCIMKYASM